MELGIAGDAMAFVQDHDGARPGRTRNSGRDPRGIALHSVEPAHAPADQGEPAPIEFRMNKNVFQSNGRAEKTGGAIRRGAQ